MNKTEERYAWHLQRHKIDGRILWFEFEAVTLRLTSKVKGVPQVSYTPDFMVVLSDGSMRMDEVKGPYVREDSDLKFKLAADRFPMFEWQMMQAVGDEPLGFRLIRHVPRRMIGDRGPVQELPQADR